MWSMMKNLMGQGDGWGKFLPFIILMVVYGLSSIFKNKPKKPNRPPARRPEPSAPTPQKTQTRRPVPTQQAKARPVAKAPSPAPARSQPRPVGKPITQTTRHIQKEPKPRRTDHHPKPARTSTSAKTAVRALHSRHPHVSRPDIAQTRHRNATERLVENTRSKGPLAQAILYSEILGTPMSLRPMGSHNYSALGSSGTG